MGESQLLGETVGTTERFGGKGGQMIDVLGLAGTEERLVQFAGLVTAALSNVQARTELQALADAQAALRAVAELAAQGPKTWRARESVVVRREQ